MEPIKLQDFLQKLVADILSYNTVITDAFLKDGDGQFHLICDVGLYRDRITCEDGYWDCYEWIMESEKDNVMRLFYKS